ncbi:uncharacterized protein LOC110694170 isoform X6 [Chenopodium quinoa]|uniref:uncharacterized protein LOC110694170 isoform X6 n=1 Tax=Chenopodium quinoa TaxID=63459 RepID=UPI000B77637F|nr:uncharacterized protein LOC110694170 isoform X6 [Chenopodium quinoa]
MVAQFSSRSGIYIIPENRGTMQQQGNITQLLFVAPNLPDRDLGLCAALREVFQGTSHLLCLCHINRDVEAKVTKMFGNKTVGVRFRAGRWFKIVNATTQAEYDRALTAMQVRWGKYPEVIQYVQRTWLCHKEKFVKFWTNQVLHFGNTTNCRVESQHSAVKTWFESSTVLWIPYGPESIVISVITSYKFVMTWRHQGLKYSENLV